MTAADTERVTTRRSRFAGLLSAMSVACTIAVVARAQSPDDGPFTRGECVGPIEASPTILSRPRGARVGQVAPGTSYTIVEAGHGYVLVRGTRFSKPFRPGTTIGWVRAADLHLLMLRNCL